VEGHLSSQSYLQVVQIFGERGGESPFILVKNRPCYAKNEKKEISRPRLKWVQARWSTTGDGYNFKEPRPRGGPAEISALRLNRGKRTGKRGAIGTRKSGRRFCLGGAGGVRGKPIKRKLNVRKWG